MQYLVSNHNVPIKLKKKFKKIIGEDNEFKIDLDLFINQSIPNISINNIPESSPFIKELENELKICMLKIFRKYKKKIENNK